MEYNVDMERLDSMIMSDDQELIDFAARVIIENNLQDGYIQYLKSISSVFNRSGRLYLILGTTMDRRLYTKENSEISIVIWMNLMFFVYPETLQSYFKSVDNVYRL